MTIHDVISNIDELSEDVVIYAQKIDGRFQPHSEATLLNLSETELELPTKVVSEKYCPGFHYFLESFMVKEMVRDMRLAPEYRTAENQLKRIIYYAEFDA